MKARLLCVALLSLAACVSGPKLVLSPQAKDDSACRPASGLAGVRRVAVLPFAKSTERRAETYSYPPGANQPPKPIYRYLPDDGASATAAVEGALGAAGSLVLVERRDLEKVLSEQSLQATGLVDPRQAAELGKMAGAEAVLLGRVAYAYAGYENKTVGGDWVGTYVPRADLDLRLVGVESGSVLWTCRVSRSAMSYAERPLVLETRAVLREPARFDAAFLGHTVEERIEGILRAAARDAVGLLLPR